MADNIESIIGVIGGSGLYEMEGLSDVSTVKVDTPFGSPSDSFVTGMLGDVKLIFLPRHGKGHKLLPSEINYRANIYGMKVLGVKWLISVSAVGSMKEAVKPGDVVLVDQFFDRTKGRKSTFFGDGIAAHVEFAEPVCNSLGSILFSAGEAAGATVHKGGTYLCMEGPQFSTRAESNIYRSWGVDVIGMTNIPEAKLAREAELCYCTIALATDYDCWHETEESVSVEGVLAVLSKNVAMASSMIANAAKAIGNGKGKDRDCKCRSALQYAILTDRSSITEEAKKRLEPLIGKYM